MSEREFIDTLLNEGKKEGIGASETLVAALVALFERINDPSAIKKALAAIRIYADNIKKEGRIAQRVEDDTLYVTSPDILLSHSPIIEAVSDSLLEGKLPDETKDTPARSPKEETKNKERETDESKREDEEPQKKSGLATFSGLAEREKEAERDEAIVDPEALTDDEVTAGEYEERIEALRLKYNPYQSEIARMLDEEGASMFEVAEALKEKYSLHSADENELTIYIEEGLGVEAVMYKAVPDA